MFGSSKIDNNVENETQNEAEVHWEPVAELEPKDGLDPYEDVDENIRTYHRNYVNMWLKKHKTR